MFNFVLDKGHVVEVNGIACVTLGHGFTEKNVQHSYFGTRAIINDLKSCGSGWKVGYIQLKSDDFERDKINQRVCKINSLQNL